MDSELVIQVPNGVSVRSSGTVDSCAWVIVLNTAAAVALSQRFDRVHGECTGSVN